MPFFGANYDPFNDKNGSIARTNEMLAAGADVVFAAAGTSGSEAIKHAAAAGAWVIGVDTDECVLRLLRQQTNSPFLCAFCS